MNSEEKKNKQEEYPILILWDTILRHKKIVISFVTFIIIALGGVLWYRYYSVKKEAQKELQETLEHVAAITGTYKGSYIILKLNPDNTASLTTGAGSYDEAVHLGHWEEKADGYPIQIDFSDSFEASMCGKSDGYFSTLYFFSNALWPNLDAIQSMDYSKAETLTKQK